MDGVLVVDKPCGPTSHDVVACARRALGLRGIGHTGTLDPLATGVLPLACGRATRLVRFLMASHKDYDATIRFGVTTDTYDITGTETSRTDRVPAAHDIERALESFAGTHLQTPPPYSAKKIGGHRAYDLARRQIAAILAPVEVTASRIELLELENDRARVMLTCSAGFYVRTFAHALGEALGTGACLEALRRTRSGDFSLDSAVPLASVTEGGPGILDRMVPLGRLLPDVPAVTVTSEGRARVGYGQELDARHIVAPPVSDSGASWVRLLDSEGLLLGLATPARAPGSLHPSVVLI